MTELSVVIPFRGDLDWLEEQFEALSRQVVSIEWEVVVADNGPTSGLSDLVERYEARISGLRIVDASDRAGAAHARNTGARQARGDKLAFIDADDVAGDGWVAAIAAAIGPDRLVASRWDTVRLNRPEVRAGRRNGQESSVMSYTYPAYLPHAGGCGLGVMRNVHEAIGGFDEDMALLEDTDYCWRVQLAGYSLVFAYDALIHIRYRDTALDSFRQSFGYGVYNVLLYKRFRDRGMPRLRPVVGLGHLAHVLTHAYLLLSPTKRLAWLRSLGFHLGRVRGTFLFHVWAL